MIRRLSKLSHQSRHLICARPYYKALEPSFSNHKFGGTISYSATPEYVELGDLVEFKTGSERHFGIITFCTINSTFDALTLDGRTQSAELHDISFLMRLSNKLTTAAELQKLCSQAKCSVEPLLPYTRVAHANFALPRRIRPVGFESLVDCVFRSRYRAPPSPNAMQILALYYALTYHDTMFVRLEQSPFAAVCEHTADSINRVTAATEQDLSQCAAWFRSKLRGSRSFPSSLCRAMAHLLLHYQLFNDERLDSIIKLFVKLLGINASLYEVLDRAGYHQSNIWLQLGSIAWERAKDKKLVDGLNSKKLLSGESNIQNRVLSPPKFEGTAFKFQDVGVSVATEFERYRVSIHIPVIMWVSIMARSSPLAIRAASLGSRLPLVEQHVRGNRGLVSNDYVPCVSVSCLLNPWNYQRVYGSEAVGLNLCKAKIVPQFFDMNKEFSKDDMDAYNLLKDILKGPYKVPDFDRFSPSMSGDFLKAHTFAGEWLAEWAKNSGVDLCYLTKRKLKEYPEVNPPGSVECEQVSSIPLPYEPLNLKAFAPIANVFDSSLALVNQQQVIRHLTPPTSLSRLLPKEPVAEAFKRHVMPAKQFSDIWWPKARLFGELFELKKNAEEKRLFLFRCIVFDDCLPGKDVDAHCFDLGINIKVRATMPLYSGDQIVCEKILECDPFNSFVHMKM